jgi:hypothetical protein
MCFRVNKIPRLHPHFQGHDAFTALVDETRALKTKGPLYYTSEDSSPIGFIMGLDPNDCHVRVTNLINKMSNATHPIVVNMTGSMMHFVFVFVFSFVFVFVFGFVYVSGHKTYFGPCGINFVFVVVCDFVFIFVSVVVVVVVTLELELLFGWEGFSKLNLDMYDDSGMFEGCYYICHLRTPPSYKND